MLGKIGIIRYPGSNCDLDTYNYFNRMGFSPFFISHTETELQNDIELIVIPGGFAFGDRVYNHATEDYIIKPGKMAIQCPVTKVIIEANNKDVPILGICNGFQILIELNLLPGKLEKNKNNKFTCKKVKCTSYRYNTELYIANSYGRYSASQELLDELIENNQIFLEYDNDIEEVESLFNIAGISNKKKTIFGMMPHPERNNDDFKWLLCELLFNKNNFFKRQRKFYSKINSLMNSEHISYKSTKKYLKTLPTKADWVIQGPGENAGIVDIGDDYCIAIRIESHNHPTFIDPFEGAATGVGGIMRDIFTMGARPIGILDFLRFGTDDNSKILMEKAVDGISYYGNCVGVANIGGDYYNHVSYNKNPLVNVACLGIVKKENIVYGHASKDDQILIYVGSKTGNEGIGGAEMASNSFNINDDIDNLKNNVQKSDPFLEKLLLEACIEITEKKLIIGMQDLGAGGLLCATQEVIKRGRNKFKSDLICTWNNIGCNNIGCNIYLDKVPLKHDMEYHNILISESQERMLIVANSANLNKIFDILKKWDLEYANIGEVTNNGIYSIYYNNEIQYIENLEYDYRCDIINDDIKCKSISRCKSMSEPIKSYNLKYRQQYDSTIGNRTINLSDNYSIIDIYEINKKLIVSWGDPQKCLFTIKSIDVLARPLCIVDCLNYGDPNNYEVMLSINEYINYLKCFCNDEKIPVIGGNVSLYNCTDNKSIENTPIIVMLAIID